MGQTSGFFVSQNGDRVYTPAWLAQFVRALVTSGVYADEVGVTAMDGMTVAVGQGRAWIEGYLYNNDGPLTLVIGTASASLHRKDSIVLRLDLNERTIEAYVVAGTPAAKDPVAPEVVRTADRYELKIAEVYVPAGTTAITQPLITDTRLDDAVCGITVSAVQHIPTAAYMVSMEAEFRAWFEHVQGILGTDEAGNLLQLIEANAAADAETFAALRREMADGDAAVHPITAGGTGAVTAEQARTNLGITPDNIGAIAKMKLLATQKVNGQSGTGKNNSVQRIATIPAAVNAQIVGVYFTGTISSDKSGYNASMIIGEAGGKYYDGIELKSGTYNKKFMGYVLNGFANTDVSFEIVSGGEVRAYSDSSDDEGYPAAVATVNGTLEYYGVNLA